MVRRTHAIGVAVLFVIGFVGVASGLTAPEATAPRIDSNADSDVVPSSTVDGFTRATFTITVYQNGSIRWTTRYSKPLNNESEVSAFESYADRFNTTEIPLYEDFVAQAQTLASRGTQATNRTTRVRGFRKRAYVEEGGFNLEPQGKVEMSFLWTNISRVSGNRVTLGEAFDSGLYIGPNQKLIFEPGPNLVFTTAVPDPHSQDDPASLRNSDWISYQGEYQFNPQRPLIELVPPGSIETPTPTPTTSTAKTPTTTLSQSTGTATTLPRSTTPVSASGGSGGTMLVVAVIVLLLGLGTAAVYRTMHTTDGGAETPAATTTESTSPADGTAAEAGETQSEAAPATSTQPVTDEDLLTDTDRVQSLLESHGGRMRQSAIVEETEWSKSKVSMLLSDMEEEDEITKLRVGRENIISLPGHEPDAAGSPFEDDE